MVIRFPLHTVCIFLGISFCFYGFFPTISDFLPQAVLSSAQQEHILILDPGHGGLDGGAVGIDGTKESEINLKIAQKTGALCNLLGIPYLLTRESEEIPYPNTAKTIAEKKNADQRHRLEVINSTPNGVLMSIHQNAYPSPSVQGFQVLFGHNEESQKLGNCIQDAYNSNIASARRLASEIPSNIYLFRDLNHTAVLIECGFISNRDECILLQTDIHQLKLASILTASYLQYINSL